MHGDSPYDDLEILEEMVKAGSDMASLLCDASLQKSLGGLGGCKEFNLNDYPEEWRDSIQKYVDNKITSVEAIYKAMAREKQKCPFLSVDIVIRVAGDVVVIERKNPPLGFALPGGFVDYGETVEDAAKREAKEETGLDVHSLRLVGVYSDPKRDPRAHIVTVAFLAEAYGTPVGMDDAKTARLVTWADLLDAKFSMVADHKRIARDAWMDCGCPANGAL